MAIEEEFSVEIPDAEADEITTVGQGGFSGLLGVKADIQQSSTLRRPQRVSETAKAQAVMKLMIAL